VATIGQIINDQIRPLVRQYAEWSIENPGKDKEGLDILWEVVVARSGENTITKEQLRHRAIYRKQVIINGQLQQQPGQQLVQQQQPEQQMANVVDKKCFIILI
jgi:hypothetical protein